MSAEAQFVVVDVAVGDAMRRIEEKIRDGEASTLPELGGWLGRMGTLLTMRIAGGNREPTKVPDRILRVAEVAERLGQSRSWVYAHQGDVLRELRVPLGKGVKFSERGLERYIERRGA